MNVGRSEKKYRRRFLGDSPKLAHPTNDCNGKQRLIDNICSIPNEVLQQLLFILFIKKFNNVMDVGKTKKKKDDNNRRRFLGDSPEVARSSGGPFSFRSRYT